MKPKRIRLFYIFLLLVWLTPTTFGQAAPVQQGNTPEEQAASMLALLTPEERVGQLFLVTFEGPEAGAGSATGNQIYELIINYHVGGVVLRAANNNFVGVDQTIAIAQSLTGQLQRNEYNASQSLQINPVTNESFRPAYIPLFIGISQEGDGYPYDQLLSGMTPLPSPMALGATWNTDLARQVGEVLGRELNGLGFNLLLGPSLDVIENPNADSGGDLGVRTFGGDPFWVGQMGQAYISGVHQGSNGEMAVVAKHFPGFGGSDRLPEEEVATVRKSLEQLKQIELAPFFSVTGNSSTPEAVADALLTSHIRYQGFQGNIRATTKPVSFDPQAFLQLMSLPPFTTWRQNGGLMVSDDLGSRAVRRFYDPTGQTFNGRFVARDAFLAGSDLLYLGNFRSSSDPDAFTTITTTLAFFAQKYREDAAFAQRVDESVLRILTLKYRLYGNTFSITDTLPDANVINQLGSSTQVTFDVARQAATLISPSLAELDDAIPDPPGRDERIVFISDTRIYQQCSNCRQEFVLNANALESAVLRFYSGTGGAGQVLPGNLESYSFQDLQDMLIAGTGALQIENDLRQADWIVVAMLNVTPSVPSSLAFKQFLDQRPDLLQGKNIIAFALNAPYYLDATDISKLTAYYGLFSRSSKFIEVAARLLFQEIQPEGALPVTVEGAGYNLNTATFPDPDQTIALYLDLPTAAPSPGTSTPDPTLAPAFRIGDTIPVRTGVILDHNGHIVPDGTPVQFFLTHNGDTAPSQQVEAQTSQGIARATLRVDRSGALSISVQSDPAKLSDVLVYDIPPENVTPTEPGPTTTLAPSPTATEFPTETPTNTPSPTPTPVDDQPRTQVNLGDWLGALLGASVIGGASYGFASKKHGLRWGVRAGLMALAGGLFAYSYLALDLPGSAAVIERYGVWGVLTVAVFGAAIGTGAAWGWQTWQARQNPKA